MSRPAEWFDIDYYDVLGVPTSASESDIRAAYRRLARGAHPDANPGDAGAEAQFKAASAAYDVLGDADRRQAYDELRRRDAARPSVGASRSHTGFRVRVNHRPTAEAESSPIDAAGRRARVRTSRDQPEFGRRGDDLTLTVPVSYGEAVLGTQIAVPTPDGSRVTVRIPAGTPPGRTLRVAGRGLRRGSRRGDLLITVTVDVPTDLTPTEGDLLRLLAEAGAHRNPRACWERP